MVDGGQDRRIRPKQGLALELEVLGQGQDDRLGARSDDLVVPVDDALLDGDRREGRRVDIVGDTAEDVLGPGDDDAASRAPGDDDADPDARRPRRRSCRRRRTLGPRIPTPDPPAGRRVAVANRPKLVRRRSRFGDQPVEERTSRAHDDQATEQGDLGPELVGLRRHQERAGHGDEEAEHDAADTSRPAPSSDP